MTIALNSDLQLAVANLLNRTDMSARIPEWIASAESRMYYGASEAPYESDPVRIRSMEQSSYTTINTSSVELPPAFLQVIRFYISGDSGRKLGYMSPDDFWDRFIVTTSGRPYAYTIEAENLLFGPTPDGLYTTQMLYYKAFAPLVNPGDTNWLLTNAPYIYLHGACLEGFRYLRNFDAANSSHAAFVGLVNSLNNTSKRDRFSGPWVSKVDFCTSADSMVPS